MDWKYDATDPDPIASLPYRVVWVGDFDERLLLLEDEKLILADAFLSRYDVAEQARRALKEDA